MTPIKPIKEATRDEINQLVLEINMRLRELDNLIRTAKEKGK